MFYKSLLKPPFDFFLSLLALLLLSPLFFLITLLLTIANSGKPFFTQTRPGKNARLFKVIKFKTMNDKRDKAGRLMPDAVRLTLIGKLTRNAISETSQCQGTI